MKNKKRLRLTFAYTLLIALLIIWFFPIAWVVLTSFRSEGTAYVNYFIPKTWTLDNYIKLFTLDVFPFGQWSLNILLVATASCIISTLITVAMTYSLSRIRFKHRNGFLKLAPVPDMFPGFMSMIAVHYILKASNLDQTLLALALIYLAGAVLGFYIIRGFFDTIPYSLDESVMIDGATRADIFFKTILPLSKPITVYAVLMALVGSWTDFIFAKIILGDATSKHTVVIGLFSMLQQGTINDWFMSFTADSVITAIPITLLFMSMQKYYVEDIAGDSVKQPETQHFPF